MKKRANRAYSEGKRAHHVSQAAMRRVSGVGGGIGVIGWAIVVGWLVGGRRRGEEGGEECLNAHSIY